MGALFAVLLLTAPAWARYIIEGPINEIAEATEAVTGLDRELANPQTAPERRAEAQAARTGHVQQIANVAAAHPANAEVNIAAASNLVRVNEPARAEVAAERAVLAAPQNPDGYLHRGQARMAQGKFEDAVKDFQAVLQRRPGDPVATAGLKLSEGRTATTTPQQTPARAPDSRPGEQAPPTTTSSSLSKVSEFDRRLAGKRRAQEEALMLYNASKIAHSAGDWQAAMDNADKALALSPDDAFLKRHLDALQAAHQESLRAKTAAPVLPDSVEPEPIGSADFIGGLAHYVGKSKKPRRVDFRTIDTSDVRVIEFLQVREELAKPVDGERRVRINDRKWWTAKGSQSLLIGNFRLRLRGDLTIHKDCRWTFQGSLRAFDDYYDFNKSKRGLVGETLTAMGRMLPGNEYDLEIRGVRPVREEGTKETCP